MGPYELGNTGGGIPPGGYGGGAGDGGGLIGALVSAGALIYDSYNDRKSAKENTDKTLAANKREAELAYQRQREMWDLQNQYNDPASQMARWRNAGLSPHLMYGQGNSGNASSFPQYQPAEQRYNYQAAHVGPGLTAILPMMMEVGSWMQDMRLKEVQIDRSETDINRTQQMIDFLTERNPQLLKEGSNKLSMFPYEREIVNTKRNAGLTALAGLQQKFRQDYGEELFSDLTFQPGAMPSGKIGGLAKLKFMEQEAKTQLAQAKASWSDMSITDPQAIIQMVLAGVMGYAGVQLRAKPKLSTHVPEKARRTGVRRIHPARRVQREKFNSWTD